jgi:Slime mold cyclic AMP receptor
MPIQYDQGDERTIYYTDLACSSLSIIGCTIIVLLFLSFPGLRKLPFRLIFYLILADLGTSISLVFPYMDDYSLCQLQGYLISYCGLSSVLWCACIAHAISKTILSEVDVKVYEKYYLIIGFLVPLLTFLVLIDINSYQESLGWCWIYQEDYNLSSIYFRQVSYALITFYLPLFIVIIYIIIQYFKTIKAIKNEFYFIIDKEVSRKMIVKLRIYPTMLIIMWSPVIVVRFMSFFTHPWWCFTLIAGIGVSLNGLVNSIIYGHTQEVRNEISKLFVTESSMSIKMHDEDGKTDDI